MEPKKIYYTPSELTRLGVPKERAYEIARKVGRKSSEAKRGFKYLLTLEEVRKWLE